jgi:long-chain acyl-CoA synthetase
MQRLLNRAIQVESIGARKLTNPIPATLDQIATICYTSGTTSTPKGVVLTHRNLSAAMSALLHGIPDLGDNWSMISYLPLAHIYERVFEVLVASCGAKIGYFTGNPLNLIADVQALKPDFFPSVPRVLNK